MSSDCPAKEIVASCSDDLLRSPHAFSADLITNILEVDADTGLSSDEAEKRLIRDGRNSIQHEGGAGWLRILLNQFSSIVVWLLAVAAVIAWLTNGALEASAILVVLVLNAFIGFAIEWRAGRALDALRREAKTKARVRRNGGDHNVDASKLVAGDVVILSAGMRVPADARLIEAVNLRADESTLTGESVPVEKLIDSVHHASLLAERRSMLYLGTTVVSGRALAVVTATGARTELGRIGQLIAKTSAEKTPLERRLADLGRRLVYVVLGIAAVVMFAGFVRGDEIWLMLEVSISLAVAAVPEGLPAVTTLILALGVLRMARRHAIVRRLAAVETLGSTTVICTDKTGTLTENRMTVQEYSLANRRVISLSNSEKDDSDESEEVWKDPNFLRLLLVSLLCNEASFDTQNALEQAIGDPTETALLVAVDKLGFDLNEKACFEKLLEQPFDAATKRMITVLKNKRDADCLATMKGAPKVVLDACSYFVSANGETLPLDESGRREFLAINEEMASRALRVLAFADKPLKNVRSEEMQENPSVIESGYTFLGFVGMSDPLREGAAKAVREAHRAGIRVVMLTGDQIMTARAIARDLDLSQGSEISTFHAADMADANSECLADLTRQAHVFARVSPEDKLRIVEALQKSGEIVAVTGDGVNDAPALKRAEIGIAMGERGTEVAKEAADVVLTDDNFSTIVKAIEGGRTIYANIIKFVHLLFSDNFTEVLVIFLAIVAGLPLPLLPLQILWINLVTDVFPALALAVEPASPDTMKRPPHNPGETLLSGRFMFLIFWKGVIYSAIVLGVYLWALQTYGEGAHSRTIALFALVAVQLGNLFNCRSRTRSAFVRFFGNPFVFVASGIVIALQLLAIHFPPLSRVLDTVPLNTTDYLLIVVSIILPVIIVEITKAFSRMKSKV